MKHRANPQDAANEQSSIAHAQTQPKQSGRSASGVLAIICLVAILPFQAGYLQTAACVVGLLACTAGAVCAIRAIRAGRRLHASAWLFAAVAALYVVSAGANGLTITTLSSAGSWAGVAGFALLVGSQTSAQRAWTMRVFTWVGIIAGILGAVGWGLGVAYFIDGERLQFVTGYANVMGIWQVMTALLCWRSGDARLRAWVPICLLAWALTQSFGALLAFILVGAWLAVKLTREQQVTRLFPPLLQVVVAGIAFGMAYVVPQPASALVAVLVIAACVAWWKTGLDARLTEFARAHPQVLWATIGVLALAVVAAAILASGRLGEAWEHLMERFIQMRDASVVLLSAPLLGVGPNNWQYVYPFIQTAQYHAATIHNSYLMVADDIGIIGFAAFSAAIVLGLSTWLKSRGENATGGTATSNGPATTDADTPDSANVRKAQGACGPFPPTSLPVSPAPLILPALAALLIHFLVDFDLRFAFIAYVLVLLVVPPAHAPKESKAKWLLISATVAAGLLGLIFSFLGLLACLNVSSLALAVSTGDAEQAVEAFSSGSLISDDVGAQNSLCEALFDAGDTAALATYYANYGANSDEQCYYVASALYALGRNQEAGELVVSMIEQQPGNYQLFVMANALISTYGLDSTLHARYLQAIDRANELTSSGIASLMSNQKISASILGSS